MPEKKQIQNTGKKLIYSFDSGNGLSLEDTQAHVMVNGITGSGKTTSVGLPLLKGALETGCAAFIADHKGNLRQFVRKICKIIGREKDIIEFGTGPLAKSVNIFTGLPVYQVRGFFSGMMRQLIGNSSHNMSFYERGVQYCMDVFNLLRIMNQSVPNFPQPCLSLVCEAIMDEDNCQELYNMFKKDVYDEKNEEHYDLVRKVESDSFNILFFNKKVSETIRKEQMAYALDVIKTTMHRFLEVPELKQNFSANHPNAKGVDFKDALNKRKIILFRLNPGIGPVGDDLCRMFVEAWYRAIIERGINKAAPSVTFLDEFQSICDLSDNRFSDKRFVAECREFKGSVIALTQTVSGLGRGTAVDSLVHNFNTKIMLYNSDPATKDAVSSYGDADLTNLKRGDAFVVRYDSSTGEHYAGDETCNQAYLSIKQELESVSDSEIKKTKCKNRQWALVDIIKEFKKTEHKKKVPEQFIPAAAFASLDFNDAIPQEVMDDALNKTSFDQISEQFSNDYFINKYPRYFSENARINCPKGWLEFIDARLETFKEFDMPIDIVSIGLKAGEGKCFLDVECSKETSFTAKKMMSMLLRDVIKLCPLCGAKIESENPVVAFCDLCVERYNLSIDGYIKSIKYNKQNGVNEKKDVDLWSATDIFEEDDEFEKEDGILAQMQDMFAQIVERQKQLGNDLAAMNLDISNIKSSIQSQGNNVKNKN